MGDATFLGLDLGTSGLRALLISSEGKPLGEAQAHYPVSNPYPGWSEQNPAEWIAALDTCVSAIRKNHPAFANLAGIGVAGHMHGACLLDAHNEVIRPCILWNDTRSSEEAAYLDSQLVFREISGNIVFPGFTAPKLAWVKSNEPENFARLSRVLLPAAFLNWFLTGQFFADMSDSAGTSWLNVGRRDWAPELLERVGMQINQMPRLVEGSEAAGHLRSDLALNWGVSSDVVVAGGAGDNAAAACGTGVLAQGQGFLSLGTSGVVLTARDGYAPDPASAVHTFCHAVPNRWYQMSVMLSATDSLNWLSRVTGEQPAQLTSVIGETLRGPCDVRFLPYLSGERSPHNDANIRGAFTGLGVDTSKADLTQAVIEGVAFGMRDGAEALKKTGAVLDNMLAIGGGTASPYWVKLLATVLDMSLALPSSREFGAALGAARLGLTGATGRPPEEVMTSPEISKVIEPELSMTSAFDDAYETFKLAYPAIRSVQ